MTDHPQLYLVSPRQIDLARFPKALEAVLDACPVACFRLALAGVEDEATLIRAVDLCREVTVARDVALVLDDHLLMAQRLGLDGVHLTDGGRSVRTARAALGPDAIVGSFCGTSRHDGMTAAEHGADYVSFGPVAQTGLGQGDMAERDLFAWWSEMIEVPVVAEGALSATQIPRLAPVTDFFAVSEIWAEQDPARAVRAWYDLLRA